jgi:hypothetical protein
MPRACSSPCCRARHEVLNVTHLRNIPQHCGSSMMLTAGRNQIGLTERQIEYCLEAWVVLCADNPVELDTSEARQHSSRTRFNEEQNKVFLGSDALPGEGVNATSRMSTLACLAHELAHAERFGLGYVALPTCPKSCWTKPRLACGPRSHQFSG